MLKIDFHLIPVFPVQHLTLYLMFLSIDLFYLHREHNGKVQPAGRRQWKAGVSRGYALRERMRRRLSKTPGASSPRCLQSLMPPVPDASCWQPPCSQDSVSSLPSQPRLPHAFRHSVLACRLPCLLFCLYGFMPF